MYWKQLRMTERKLTVRKMLEGMENGGTSREQVPKNLLANSRNVLKGAVPFHIFAVFDLSSYSTVFTSVPILPQIVPGD